MSKGTMTKGKMKKGQSGHHLVKKDDSAEALVNEAASHEEEDRARRDLVEKRNQLDNFVYQTEKLLKENDEAVPAELKEKLEAAISEGRAAVESDDDEQIAAAMESIEALNHELAQVMYQNAGGAPGAGEAGFEQAAAAAADDNVIDAEFEESD